MLAKHRENIFQLEFKLGKQKTIMQNSRVEISAKNILDAVIKDSSEECSCLLFGSVDISFAVCMSKPKFMKTAKYAAILEAKMKRPKLSAPT